MEYEKPDGTWLVIFQTSYAGTMSGGTKPLTNGWYVELSDQYTTLTMGVTYDHKKTRPECTTEHTFPSSIRSLLQPIVSSLITLCQDTSRFIPHEGSHRAAYYLFDLLIHLPSNQFDTMKQLDTMKQELNTVKQQRDTSNHLMETVKEESNELSLCCTQLTRSLGQKDKEIHDLKQLVAQLKREKVTWDYEEQELRDCCSRLALEYEQKCRELRIIKNQETNII